MTGTISYQDLFEPLAVKGKTFPNRIVMPPMVSVRNILKPQGRNWYVEHARGGVGLVIVEATPLGLLTEKNVPGLRRLVDAVHREGSLIAIQLFSNGQPEPDVVFFEKAYEPHELTREQLEGLVDHFARAAEACQQAGFDGVEPHGAHGYFLTRCFSPIHNRREDKYGGPLENRMRMAVKICRNIRKAVGKGMLLLYRHTPVEESEGGYSLAETLHLAGALAKEGLDVLDVSPSHGDRDGEYSEVLRLATELPVIARGGLDDPDRALDIIRNRRADLVAVGRGLIADPDWPRKVREGRLGSIVKCVRCDERCYGNLRKREPIGCTQWREE